MSHKKTVIEPAPGLTVIVGPNNCGKSAVIVALECLLRNEGGTGVFVRHGEKEAKVTVWTEEGDRIQWIRPANAGGRYTLNVTESEPSRLGQSRVPDWLNAKLKMPDIEGINVHLSQQKSPIFLLDEKAGVVARFFSSTSDAGLLVRMQKRLQEKKQETTGTRNNLFREIELQEKQVERYSGVADLEVSYRALESGYAKWTAARAKSNELSRVIETGTARTTEIGEFEVELGALRSLSAPPQMTDTSRLWEVIEAQAGKDLEIVRSKQESQALSPLAAPPILHDPAPLHGVCRLMARGQDHQELLQARQMALSALEEAPALFDTSSLTSHCRQVESKSREVSGWELRNSALGSLGEPPTLEDSRALESQLQDLERKVHEVGVRSTELKSQVSAMEEVMEALRAAVAANPICPTCGGPLQVELLLKGGHAHE